MIKWLVFNQEKKVFHLKRCKKYIPLTPLKK